MRAKKRGWRPSPVRASAATKRFPLMAVTQSPPIPPDQRQRSAAHLPMKRTHGLSAASTSFLRPCAWPIEYTPSGDRRAGGEGVRPDADLIPPCRWQPPALRARGGERSAPRGGFDAGRAQRGRTWPPKAVASRGIAEPGPRADAVIQAWIPERGAPLLETLARIGGEKRWTRPQDLARSRRASRRLRLTVWRPGAIERLCSWWRTNCSATRRRGPGEDHCSNEDNDKGQRGPEAYRRSRNSSKPRTRPHRPSPQASPDPLRRRRFVSS